jgi:hypothetical protein
MKIVVTIDVPNATEEGLLEELELDIMDAIQCGEHSGVAGHRCFDEDGNRVSPGIWTVEFISHGLSR